MGNPYEILADAPKLPWAVCGARKHFHLSIFGQIESRQLDLSHGNCISFSGLAEKLQRHCHGQRQAQMRREDDADLEDHAACRRHVGGRLKACDGR